MPNSLIPVGDEQAKAIQEALVTLRAVGEFLKNTLGTVPEDLVGVLGGDWLKVRRAESFAKIAKKRKKGCKPAVWWSISPRAFRSFCR